MKKLKAGFTLAEVLITLTVIGVVASMTIPTLMNNINDAQYKATWKKAYSTLRQASMRLMSDEGGSLYSSFLDDNEMKNKFTQYFSVIKNCDGTNASNNCWHLPNTYRYLNGDLVPYGNRASAILSDGMMLLFMLDSSQCTHTLGSFQRCGWISVDVNGFKGPNTYGKDLYFIHIARNGLLPYGIDADGRSGDCTATGQGWGCAAKYLYE